MELSSYSAGFWAAAAFAVVFVGIAKAGFGGGAGIVGTPLLALTVSVEEAVAIMLPLLIFSDGFSVLHYRDRFDRRNTVQLLAGAAVGILLGWAFFERFIENDVIMRRGLGAIAVLFVIYQVVRGSIQGTLEGRRPGVAAGLFMGWLSGFASTLAHAGGAPVSMHLLPQRLPRDLFVGTTVIVFAGINLLKVGPYIALGLYHWGNISAVAVLAPLTWIGVRSGVYLNRRFDDLWFNRVVYGVLLVAGIKLLS
ncbi:MAG: sulfite exporter TauE/SafE family protein [Candidatus Latescibacterota bacterium]|nr:sulfite exporter TauE/SafE family protein [Candidatus Latescibacterota bacterium]